MKPFLLCCLLSVQALAQQTASPKKPTPAQQRVKDDMLDAATTFLGLLTPDQRKLAIPTRWMTSSDLTGIMFPANAKDCHLNR